MANCKFTIIVFKTDNLEYPRVFWVEDSE